MNDLEKLISIIEGKTDYRIKEGYEGYKGIIPNLVTSVTFQNSKYPNGKSLGYDSFISEWYFDKNGQFIEIANWE